MICDLSLTPGFNPVCHDAGCRNRFNGFPPAPNKPLKRFSHRTSFVTGLKPGVNEKGFSIPAVPSEQQKPVERLVERILSAKQRDVGLRSEASSPQAGADVTALELELDELVYALYALTPDEIKIVKGTAK
jgi:hypothetical protein